MKYEEPTIEDTEIMGALYISLTMFHEYAFPFCDDPETLWKLQIYQKRAKVITDAIANGGRLDHVIKALRKWERDRPGAPVRVN